MARPARLEHPSEAPASVLMPVRFAAMGTTVSVIVHPVDQAEACGERLRTWFEQVESAASRFRPESELNRLATGAQAEPSPLLAALLRKSLAVALRSGGLVTPFVRPALESFGYDVSFDQIAGSRPAAGSPGSGLRRPQGDTAWGEVDFGGTGKGWAVDEGLRRLAPHCDGAFIDAGGDIGVFGPAPGGGPWWIDVDAPGRDDPPLRAALRGGGIATSSVLRRAWIGPAGPAHHLIDPRSQRPAQSDVVQATAWARSTLWAEVATKALVIGGRGMAPEIRTWLPEVVLATTTRDGAFEPDPAFREEVLTCAT